MNALLEDMRNEETCYDRIVRASSKEAFYERNKIESEYMYFGSPDRKYFGAILWEWRSKIKNYKNPRDYNAIIQDWITLYIMVNVTILILQPLKPQVKR